MSKKDFEMIAGVLRESRPDMTGAASLTGLTHGERRAEFDRWSGIVTNFARELAATNPRFNRARFLTACGCGEELKPAKGGRS